MARAKGSWGLLYAGGCRADNLSRGCKSSLTIVQIEPSGIEIIARRLYAAVTGL